MNKPGGGVESSQRGAEVQLEGKEERLYYHIYCR